MGRRAKWIKILELKAVIQRFFLIPKSLTPIPADELTTPGFSVTTLGAGKGWRTAGMRDRVRK